MKFYFGKLSINFTNSVLANIEIKKSIETFNELQNSSNHGLRVVLENPYVDTEKKTNNREKEITLGANLTNMQNILLDNEFTNDTQDINRMIKLNFYITDNDDKENSKNVINAKEKLQSLFNDSKVYDLFNNDNQIMISDITEIDGCKLLYEMMKNKTYMIDYLFCNALSEDEKIAFKEQQNYSNVQILNVDDKKYTYDEFKDKYQNELKNQNLNEEIERIFGMQPAKDKKKTQGINYYFEEHNDNERKMQYEILTQALYSCDRIDKPYYYLINNRANKNDKNSTWNLTFLSAASKLSTNQIFFIQIDESSMGRYDGSSFNHDFGNLVDLLRAYQYVNVFGIYLNVFWLPDNGKIDNKLKDNISSFVYIGNMLNKSAQIEYANKKLNSIGHSECLAGVINAIENMNLKTIGLTTKEIDNIIQDKLRINSELYYADAYKNVLDSKMISSAYDKIMSLSGLEN